MATKGTAFTVSAAPSKAPSTRSNSKPVKREPFKFLKKFEGQRATGALTSERSGDDDNAATPRRNVPSHEEFVQAVHADRRGKPEKDPFADALVAVPKKPPPKSLVTDAAELSAQTHRLSPPSANQRNGGGRVDTAALDDPPETHHDDGGNDDERDNFAPPKPLQQTSRPNQSSAPAQRGGYDDGSRSSSRADEQQQQPTVAAKPVVAATRPRSRNEMLGLTERPRHAQPEIENEFDDEDDVRPTRATEGRPQSRVAPAYYNREEPPLDYEQPVPQAKRVNSHQTGVRRYPTQQQQQPKHADPLDHDDDGYGDDAPYDNYFPGAAHRAAPRTSSQPVRAKAAAPPVSVSQDDEIMEELTRQLEEVRAEKVKLQRLNAEAIKRRDHERKLQEASQSELQAEREEFETWLAEEKKNLRREKKQLEEQRKRQAEAAGAEREANRRMQNEVEAARDTLEKMSVEMRDKDRAHKAETDRLRRQIADLQARNDELSEMIRSVQAAEAENAVEVSRQQDKTRNTLRPSAVAAHAKHRHAEISEDDDDERDVDTAAVDEPYNTSRQQPQYGGRGTAVNDRYADESRLGINHSSDAAQLRGGRANEAQRPANQPAAAAANRASSAAAGARRQSPPQDDDYSYGAASGSRSARGTMNPQQAQQQAPARSPQRGGFVIPTLAQFIADVAEPNPVEDIPGDSVTARNVGTDGKTEQLFRSGKRVITYSNGTRKVVLQSGHVILHFSNGDVKRTFPTGKTTYWYAVPQTTHTQMPDGLQVFQFHNTNQTEKHYPDGRKEILYPEGVLKKIAPDCSEVTYFPDGTARHTDAAP